MSQVDVFQSIVELLPRVSSMPIDPATLGQETRLVEDLGLSSLSLVSLMFLCSERFSVDLTVASERLYDLRTLGDATALVEGLQAAG